MTQVARLAERIASLPRPLLVALDVDGTLAPIVDDPARARVPAEVAARVDALSRAPGVLVALVTGRDAARLDRMIDAPRAWRVVEHGRAILAPGGAPAPIDAATRARLDAFESWATETLAPRGARIERKPGSVAVHARELCARDARAGGAVLEDARREARLAGLAPREGRAVVEAAVGHADKGTALAALMSRTGALSVVYAGDDLTDEPAIALASERGLGLFVRSSERPSAPPEASAALPGPEAVAELLEHLVRLLGDATAPPS